jgi:hypothetical protein
VFIVESYKKLSPDSGDTTTALLNQISRQLAGFQNNTYPQPQGSASFAPSTAVLFVNALWFLSLIIAIVSAFYVMMVRQWSRRYSQTLKELSGEQRRVQSCLFLGAQRYRMTHAIGLVPLPLHVSVFLFFAGLIVFLWPISHTMAIVVTVALTTIGTMYAALTILPIIDDICPYFTPMSDAAWYLWYTSRSATAMCFHWILERFREGYYWTRKRFWRGSESERYDGEDQLPKQDKLSKLSETLKRIIKKNNDLIKGGSRKTIFRHAEKVSDNVDLRALTWLLQRPVMGDKNKFQEFIDSIPERTLIQLSSRDAVSGEKTIREHLSELFWSCTASGKSELKEPERSARLLVCLDAYHHIVKPSTLLPDEDYETVIGDVWSNFKDTKLVQDLWDHSKPAIRVTSRSICALLARNLFRKPSKLEESERRWLRYVVDKPDSEIGPQVHLSIRDHLNLQSFAFGVLSDQKPKEELSVKNTARFAETLAILMNAGSSGALSMEIFSEEISSFIEWAEKGDLQNHDEVAHNLRMMFKVFTETQAETTQ